MTSLGVDIAVSTHSRPKAAGKDLILKPPFVLVSTHSRPKAAGFFFISGFQVFKSFNTQPPEGGWVSPD